MKLTLRITTFFDRLKYRLVEDEIDEAEIGLVMVEHDSPAWPILTRNLFALMDTRDAVRRRLLGAGIKPADYAMGNIEMLLALLGSALAVLAVTIVALGVEL
jgi:hypothetical protein